MNKQLKNFTFSLPAELLNKLRNYAHSGYAPSVNAAVREALESYVLKLEKRELSEQMKAAAEDPLFIQDLEKAMSDFSYPDFEATEEKRE